MKKYSRWTKYEDEELRRRCLEGITMAEALQLFPGRTENALQNQARKLGVPAPKGRTKTKKAARPVYCLYDCPVLEGFLRQCAADAKGVSEAQTAAAEGDCFFGRRCKQASVKMCVKNLPLPLLPGTETQWVRKRIIEPPI